MAPTIKMGNIDKLANNRKKMLLNKLNVKAAFVADISEFNN